MSNGRSPSQGPVASSDSLDLCVLAGLAPDPEHSILKADDPMHDETAALRAQWLELERDRLLSQMSLVANPEVSPEQAEVQRRLIEAGGTGQRFHTDRILFDPIARLPPLGPAQRDRLSFIIIGAGVSGLCMAARLRQASFDNFEILEKGSDLGGTWHYNTYPGLACDVPARYYSFSFFRNPHCRHLFAHGEEIKGYLQGFAEEHRLTENLSLSTRVVAARRSEGKWHVETDDGVIRQADFVMLANGFLHTPKLPDIPGCESFAGIAMHSSQVPRDFDFKGLRVGNVGTGSTTVQITSNIVDKVRKLTIFQRTPQWAFPFPNEYYPEPRRELLSLYPGLTAGLYEMFLDRSMHGLGEAVVTPDSPVHQLTARGCQANLAKVRDPVLRAKLTPDYAPMCKRLVYSADFYRAVQHEACEVVTEGIAAIEPREVRTADGVLHELDLLIFSTGYDIKGYRNSYLVENEGRSLTDAWKDGVRSLDSVAVAGFPNMFMLGGAHATVGNFSIMACAEEQSGHIVRLIGEFAARDADSIEATPKAEAQFVAEMTGALPNTIWVTGGCRSWYLNEQGGVDFWTLSIGKFVDRMREAPDLQNFEVR